METAYEAVYIVDTTLPEDQVSAIVEKYSGVVTRSGGVIDDIDRMEPRRLAYEIKTRREGLYVIMNFHSEPAAKDELDRIFRISDDVLRHLIVKQDKKADRFPSRTRASESERRDREFSARTPSAPAESGTVTDLGNVTQPEPTPAPAPAVVDEEPVAVAETVTEPETETETETPTETPTDSETAE